MPRSALTQLLTSLRADFDASFAARPAPLSGETEELLVVQVAGERYVVRLAEISGLYTDRPVTPLPDAAPGLLGVCGVRGAIVAVYDLAQLVHGQSVGGPRRPRWIALTATAPVVALAFDGIGGRLGASRSAFVPIVASTADPARRYVNETLHTEAGPYPVVDVAAVSALVVARVRRQGE